MNSSASYDHHHRDLEMIEFTAAELVARYRSGAALSHRQALDAKRIIEAEETSSWQSSLTVSK